MSGPTTADLTPFTELYNSDVITLFQSGQRLQNVMTERVSGGASKYTDRIGGQGEMTNIPFGAANLASSAVPFTEVTTSIERFFMKTAIAEADTDITNVDVRGQVAMVHGKAAGRTVDFLKLQAIFDNDPDVMAKYPTLPVMPGIAAGLTSARLLQLRNLLNRENVDLANRSIIGNSDAFIALLNDPRYTESFYVGDDRLPLPQGSMKPYLDMPLVELAGTSKNSIKQVANGDNFDSKAVVLQKDSMKMQYVSPIRTVVVYDAPNANYVVLTELLGNAQVMQPQGVGIMDLTLDQYGNPITIPAPE